MCSIFLSGYTLNDRYKIKILNVCILKQKQRPFMSARMDWKFGRICLRHTLLRSELMKDEVKVEVAGGSGHF
jgi:hypothetical protein